MKSVEIDTPAKRTRLMARKNPYWVGISGGRGGVSLGYRRSRTGAGVWIAKTIAFGGRAEERIGRADDAPAAADAIGFKAAVARALEWSSRQQEVLETSADTERAAAEPTVGSAVETYILVRKKRSENDGANARARLKRHVLGHAEFCRTKLAKLRAPNIEELVAGLVEGSGMAPSSINRLLNDLRAALYAAATKHRRQLPAHIFQEIKFGTKALDASTQARRQLLTDTQVSALVEAAFEVDESGDFGRLVLTLAATGARHSQARKATVLALQAPQSRIMMPGSVKGRTQRVKPPVAIPLTEDVIARLVPATQGRAAEEPLLERWSFRRTGKGAWGRDTRRAWGWAHEADRWWPAAVARAGVPADTVMYALRHSSIVRGLKAMLPVRLVAALHDTSIEMIEAHYAAFIVDATEDLARRAALTFAKPVESPNFPAVIR
ncbi:integrase [Reyranella sp.]|uniref:integrase n=1 Tax=Reyranella sp. TaxID=1929291 RepID=UPI003C7CB77C